jgi:hypothetical protein
MIVVDACGIFSSQVFFGTFFGFGYVLPLTLVSVLYGLMIRRLLFGDSSAPSTAGSTVRQNRRRSTAASTTAAAASRSRSSSRCLAGGGLSETARARRRVTRMVIVVVVIFAACWLPLHVVFVVQFYAPSLEVDGTVWFVATKIACTCLAYMNSCVNPILYAFLSDNFRKSFRRLALPLMAVCFPVSAKSATSAAVGAPSGRLSVAAPTTAGAGIGTTRAVAGGDSRWLRVDGGADCGDGGRSVTAIACSELTLTTRGTATDDVWKPSPIGGCISSTVTCM